MHNVLGIHSVPVHLLRDHSQWRNVQELSVQVSNSWVLHSLSMSVLLVCPVPFHSCAPFLSQVWIRSNGLNVERFGPVCCSGFNSRIAVRVLDRRNEGLKGHPTTSGKMAGERDALLQEHADRHRIKANTKAIRILVLLVVISLLMMAVTIGLLSVNLNQSIKLRDEVQELRDRFELQISVLVSPP